MKKLVINKYVLFGIAFILGAVAVWFLKPDNQKISTSENQSISTSEIWTCSMHPQVRKKEAGDCPICGMELIPLESEESNLDPEAISMSPTAMQLAQVQTMFVKKGSLEKNIRLNGKVQADERLQYTQSSHIPGRIEKLTVNFVGEFVSQGQVIAYVYSPDLVTAQEELFEAKKVQDTHPELLRSSKEKLKNWKLTDSQIEKILSSNQAIERFPILANVSGFVTQKLVKLGDYVKQGGPLYEITDLSKVWLLFDIYESDMEWIEKGDSVFYSIKSIPGETFRGEISYIDPVIDSKNRVAQARVEVKNSKLKLKPEMFASATVKSDLSSSKDQIVVPKTAVMWTGKRSLVYVMEKSPQTIAFKMREVRLGAELGERYVIESGLHEGEEIAVKGTFSIDAAAQLAGKPSMMNPEGGQKVSGHDHRKGMVYEHEDPSLSKEKIAVSEAAQKALASLYQSYFELKDALVADDIVGAKNAATQMGEGLDEVNMDEFKGEAHTKWMDISKDLKFLIEQAEKGEDIEKVRANFFTISKRLINVAELFDPMGDTIYVLHCPMANSNKGADWLSLEKE
ncbi:MAG: efflux RND transporter periplasmic adaptor subunit, partial [Vicingaceae bacterium]